MITKRIFFFTGMICSIANLYSQEKNTELSKTLFNVQVGVMGIWLNNESSISNKMVIRTELGLSSGAWARSYFKPSGILLTPLVRIEPRYYYNLEKRRTKGKSTVNNSANFLSIKTTYHPNLFVISNQNNIKDIKDFSIIPSYGMRRDLGSNFNFELSFGFGYRYYFFENQEHKNHSSAAPDINLRVGYNF